MGLGRRRPAGDGRGDLSSWGAPGSSAHPPTGECRSSTALSTNGSCEEGAARGNLPPAEDRRGWLVRRAQDGGSGPRSKNGNYRAALQPTSWRRSVPFTGARPCWKGREGPRRRACRGGAPDCAVGGGARAKSHATAGPLAGVRGGAQSRGGHELGLARENFSGGCPSEEPPVAPRPGARGAFGTPPFAALPQVSCSVFGPPTHTHTHARTAHVLDLLAEELPGAPSGRGNTVAPDRPAGRREARFSACPPPRHFSGSALLCAGPRWSRKRLDVHGGRESWTPGSPHPHVPTQSAPRWLAVSPWLCAFTLE